MKKLIFFLFIFFLFPFKVYAIETNALSSVLMDASTLTILSEEEKDKELPMASMTKMMTLLLIMEKIDEGKISLDDMIPISEYASSMGGSQVYLESHTSYKLDTLLKSICIASANDASVAVSEYIAGSTEEFVKLMNEKAASLHLLHTSFKNVHGLDEEGHYSSAFDMAIIASELIKHDTILKYSSIYEDYVEHPNGTNTWIVNTNKLINYYEGVDGLKTGYTTNSGYCITVTAKRGNMRLIAVVMGEENNKVRNQDIVNMLNYGFSNYKIEKIIDNEDDLGMINIKFGKKENVKLKLINEAVDLVNVLEENKYSYEVKTREIEAPVKVGDKVGKVNIYANGNLVSEYDLTVIENVKKANFLELYRRNLINMLKGT